jgi:hypothetical protein
MLSGESIKIMDNLSDELTDPFAIGMQNANRTGGLSTGGFTHGDI